MRDIIAALLRSAGYEHDDAADIDDLCWSHPKLGVRPMLACVAYEISVGGPAWTCGWNTYEVQIASREPTEQAPYTVASGVEV